MSEIKVQPRPTLPCPKKAKDITRITAVSLVSQLALIIQLAISSPAIIGSLRPRLALPVAFSSLSETQPPNITPPAAARNGRMAKKPTFSHGI